jgi:hypothetical protein
MTLIETTYRELHEAGLVRTREQFSTDYVGKNSNWYSYQTHMGRDFSVLTAAHCLRAIAKLEYAAAVLPQQQLSLTRIRALLSSYLREQHLAVVQS